MGKYLKDGNWYIDYYVNGRRKREKIGTSKILAENVLRKRKVEIAENRFLDIRRENKVKFEDLAEDFINLYSKPNKKSWKADVHNLSSLFRVFKGSTLHEITPLAIERYKTERLKTVSPATVNRELATLKTMFSKAIAWGKTTENPTRSVKSLKEPNGRIRFLEKEEITKLLSHCSGRLKPVVAVALHTGMRRGEILGLKWNDIDVRRNIITLLDTKNGERRELPMNEQVKTALIRVRKHPESPYIFCDKDGKPFYNLRKSFFTALKKTGIINFHFHDLRHTFASQLVMSGIDINTVRELLGHKDIRMTLRYSHLSPTHKQRAVDILSRRMDTFWTPEPTSENLGKVAIPQLAAIK